MLTSYLLVDSSEPSASAWVEACIRNQLLAFQKDLSCLIIEDDFWRDQHYAGMKRIALKLTGEQEFHSMAPRVVELAGDVPVTGCLVFVPQAVDSSNLREEDIDVSYYFAGVESRMTAPRNTSARVLYRPTGLVARSDTHRQPEANRVEAMQFLSALLAGRVSGEQCLLGHA